MSIMSPMDSLLEDSCQPRKEREAKSIDDPVSGPVEVGYATPERKKRGRPPGKTGPRPGSRPFLLANLKHGQRAFLEAPAGDVQRFMQQVAADISRGGLKGRVTQALVVGIQLNNRAMHELVMVTRVEP